MELETEGLTGAAHGDRSPARINQRNGYRDRVWETRAGTVELKIPKGIVTMLRVAPNPPGWNFRYGQRLQGVLAAEISRYFRQATG